VSSAKSLGVLDTTCQVLQNLRRESIVEIEIKHLIYELAEVDTMIMISISIVKEHM
jgi:hypothetical protein